MVLEDGGSRPYDVSNDVMIYAILKISNDDISGTSPSRVDTVKIQTD